VVGGVLPGADTEDAGLDSLAKGIRVAGLTASGTAEVVATEWHSKDAVTVVFRTEDGGIYQQVLLRGHTGSFTWEQEGFALATGREEATGSFTGLAIPHGDPWFGPITDAVLLVRPDIALAQRSCWLILGHAARPSSRRARWLVRCRSSGVPFQ